MKLFNYVIILTIFLSSNAFAKEKPPFKNPINKGNYIFTKNLIKKFRKPHHELEHNFLPILTKRKLLVSYEHKGYFYSINDKKELIVAKKKLKKYR